MLTRLLIAAATPTAARSLRRWIYHLGALGFIPLGLLDSSIIPLPGSMDVLTIVLAARDATLWPYYALMATVGSVLGGVRDLPAGAQGRERIAGAQGFSEDVEEGLRNLRTMGICGHSYTGAAATTDAPGALCAGCGGHAIFREQILVGDDAGTNCAVPDPGLPGGAVWTKDAAFAFAARTPSGRGGGGIGGYRRTGLLRVSRN
jgi:membrane protein YqaA with SNARE-associated domain